MLIEIPEKSKWMNITIRNIFESTHIFWCKQDGKCEKLSVSLNQYSLSLPINRNMRSFMRRIFTRAARPSSTVQMLLFTDLDGRMKSQESLKIDDALTCKLTKIKYIWREKIGKRSRDNWSKNMSQRYIALWHEALVATTIQNCEKYFNTW